MSAETPALIEVTDLRKHYVVPRKGRSRREIVRALDGVDLSLHAGETLSIVGESGCGKSTLAKVFLRIEDLTTGSLHYKGRDVRRFNRREAREYRTAIQAVFQNPWSALSPRMRVRDIIAEPLEIHARGTRAEVDDRVDELLEAVGLERAAGTRYPHEFSGGMKQRIAIARSLALSPDVIVLDEPVSALDVSIRAQVLNLLRRLQDEYSTTYLMIAHDLASVRYLSDRVAVMYLGQIVELAPSEELFERPLHPYTRALLAAALPTTARGVRPETILPGEVPSPAYPPDGCRFHTRCPALMEREGEDPQFAATCRERPPALEEVEPGRFVRCHLY